MKRVSLAKLQLNIETIKKFTELFENASKRPQMYFIPCNYDCVNSSLDWFYAAIHNIGFDIPDYRDEIGLKRGWKSNALGFKPAMTEKNLTDVEMAKELLIIESENWKRVLLELENQM